MKDKSVLIFWSFALISSIFFMSNNAISIIIPLKMADEGLSYASIGGVMSSFAIGVLVMKIFIGRHSDIVGQKIYIILSLFIPYRI